MNYYITNAEHKLDIEYFFQIQYKEAYEIFVPLKMWGYCRNEANWPQVAQVWHTRHISILWYHNLLEVKTTEYRNKKTRKFIEDKAEEAERAAQRQDSQAFSTKNRGF